jgi:tetratricopeptide (TPR) repeat protein
MKQILYILITITLLSCNGQEKKTNQDEKQKIQEADRLTDKGQYAKAIDILSDLESKESAYLKGFSYLRLKDYKNAILNFEIVYKSDATYKNTCFNIAQCYLEKTNWTDNTIDKTESINRIVSLLTEGINLKTGAIPNNYLAQYYANRGQAFQVSSDFKKAVLDFSKAIELDGQGDYYSRRAMTYHLMGKNDQACMDFEKGKSLGESYNEEEIRKICP